MKIAVRIFAIACVAAVAFAGNSLPRSATAPIVHQDSVPGPTPYCNPFTQVCPPIR